MQELVLSYFKSPNGCNEELNINTDGDCLRGFPTLEQLDIKETAVEITDDDIKKTVFYLLDSTKLPTRMENPRTLKRTKRCSG